MAGTGTRPRHSRDRHPMRPATNTRRVSLDEHFRGAEIQRSPPTTTLTQVVARATATARAATVPLPRDRPDRHHDRVHTLVERDTLNDRAREPARVFPYALVPHPACLLDSSR